MSNASTGKIQRRRIGLLLPERQLQELAREARQLGIDRSELIRRILDEHLWRRRKKR